MNHGVSTQVIPIRKSGKEPNFDFKLLYNRRIELLDELWEILQNKNLSIFYIHPKLKLSVSVLGLNFYFLKAEKDN